MKKILPRILFVLLLVAGAGLLAYPKVSDYVNRMNEYFFTHCIFTILWKTLWKM